MAQYDLGQVVGSTGATGNGISSIALQSTSGKSKTYRITYTNGNHFDFTVTDGSDGSNGTNGTNGRGISSISKTGTSGKVDTYTIIYSDNTTSTFTVTNGNDGSNASVTIQTSWGSTTSDSKVPSEKLTKTALDDKVSKSSTTGLLKNDGTVMSSGTGASNWAVGNHTHSAYVNPTIADNLTTDSSTQVLSAKQGKILNDMIGSAIQYIPQ